MGETRIGKGAKLDNLIQVAHNVVIGEHTVIAAQAGISGSTKIGSHCMIGGQVGFTGHIEIADGTKIGAQSGVHRSVTETGNHPLRLSRRTRSDRPCAWRAPWPSCPISWRRSGTLKKHWKTRDQLTTKHSPD